jgi:transcriptional regulator with XRE-family HTH domain
MTLGSTLKEFRFSAGLSQLALAQRAGISESFLSLLESDKREPTVRVLRNIGRALGIPPGLLLAAALQDTTAQGSENAQAAELARSFRGLLRATHHLVLSERLDREQLARPSQPSTIRRGRSVRKRRK